MAESTYQLQFQTLRGVAAKEVASPDSGAHLGISKPVSSLINLLSLSIPACKH